MKAYALKLALFLLPLALFFAVPLSVFWTSRELTSFDNILTASIGSEPVLVGLAYTNLDRPYKIAMTKLQKPQVLAFGTSRVISFTNELFKEPKAFYNAGRGVEYSSDFVPFFNDAFHDFTPKVLIFGVDPHFLDPQRDELAKNRPASESTSTLERFKSLLRNDLFTPYKQIFSGEINIGALFSAYVKTPDIGLTALIKEKGFRNDGSSAVGDTTSAAHQASLEEDTARRAHEAAGIDGGWEYNTSLSTLGLNNLRAMLTLAKEKGIHVIGFVPPYRDEMKLAIFSRNDDRSKILLLEPLVLENVFKDYDFPFFDLSLAETVTGTSSEFIDAIHGSESLYTKIMQYLGKNDSTLKSYLR